VAPSPEPAPVTGTGSAPASMIGEGFQKGFTARKGQVTRWPGAAVAASMGGWLPRARNVSATAEGVPRRHMPDRPGQTPGRLELPATQPTLLILLPALELPPSEPN
jgi:hypothetical protein